MGNAIVEFMETNNLRQIDIVRYLGISKPFMSQVVNGTAKLSPEKLTKLINNDRNWDTSMLRTSMITQTIGNCCCNNTQVIGSVDVAVLEERIQCLERLLEEKERTIKILMERK